MDSNDYLGGTNGKAVNLAAVETRKTMDGSSRIGNPGLAGAGVFVRQIDANCLRIR